MSTFTRASVARLLLWFSIYFGLVCWLTWPLVGELGTSLPCTMSTCTFDTRFSAWLLSWESHALATQPAQIDNANIYHPTPDALFYGPTGFGTLPYFAPIFLLSGDPALATNLTLLLCAALSALSLHWLVQRWTGLDAAGFVAASALLVNRWYLWGFVAATPHLASIQYFPLILGLAAQPSARLAPAALLLALVVVQSLTDPVYVAGAVLAPLGLLALARIAHRRSRRSGLALLAIVALAGICLVPFSLGHLRVRGQNPHLLQQTLWKHAVARHSDLGGLLWRSAEPATLAPAAIVLVVLGAALAWRRRRRTPAKVDLDRGWVHGALWLLVGAAISLTPVSRWREHLVYLPQFFLVETTALYETVRVPGRLGVAAMFGGCVLAGVAFAELVHALGRSRPGWAEQRAAPLALATAIACALYLIPPPGMKPLPRRFPTQDAPRVPGAFLSELRDAKGPVLQLPALSRRAPETSSLNATAMYLSIFYWRPLLNGYSSYWPAGFIERMRLGEELPSRRALAQLVEETDLATVWVDLDGSSAEKRRLWRLAAVGLTPGLTLAAEDGSQLLFTVERDVLARTAASKGAHHRTLVDRPAALQQEGTPPSGSATDRSTSLLTSGADRSSEGSERGGDAGTGDVRAVRRREKA